MGRPTKFNQEIAAEICERLARGEPLAHICRDVHMPAVRTVSDWKAVHESFSADFARAREEGFDAIAANCLDIADETENDTLYTEHGERPNAEWISRSKLRVETRLKLLAKWDPTRYGEKQALELSGGLDLRQVPDEDLEAEIAALAAQVGHNALAGAAPAADPDDASDLV